MPYVSDCYVAFDSDHVFSRYEFNMESEHITLTGLDCLPEMAARSADRLIVATGWECTAC